MTPVRPFAAEGVVLALALATLLPVSRPAAQALPPDVFDGSFQLASGEVVTGGYFVEGGEGLFLYMDTAGLERGGLFTRADDLRLRSLVPDGIIEVEFTRTAGGAVERLTWREQGRPAVTGERVYPHRSRDVRIPASDGTTLPGRLLTPDCEAPHPLVVSVHGSGPVNRYGGPYHTFFLQHGIAVLAYDKRGYTEDAAAWREPDLATLSADAAAAMRVAATQPDIDTTRLGFVGSSQAGWVVPRAAVESPAADFMILRAGAALPVLDTVLHEVRQELRTAGLTGRNLDDAMALRREVYALAAAGAPIEATDPLVAPYLDRDWYRAAFGAGPISQQWSAQRWAWHQHNLPVAGAPWVARFDGPVLWFLAGADENVPVVSTRAALERAFADAPGTDHEVVVLEDALHSFLIPDPAGGPPRFSAGFFSRMATWLAERGLARRMDRRPPSAGRGACGLITGASAGSAP